MSLPVMSFSRPDGSTFSVPVVLEFPDDDNPSSFSVREYMELGERPYCLTNEGYVFRMDSAAGSTIFSTSDIDSDSPVIFVERGCVAPSMLTSAFPISETTAFSSTRPW